MYGWRGGAVSHVEFRNWSLIMGTGGATKRRGGPCEVLPLQKGRAEKVLAISKGGGGHNKQQVLGYF